MKFSLDVFQRMIVDHCVSLPSVFYSLLYPRNHKLELSDLQTLFRDVMHERKKGHVFCKILNEYMNYILFGGILYRPFLVKF